VLDLLKDLQSHYGTYHNHKENVAWAGIALFVVLVAGIANTLRQADLSCVARAGTSLVVIGACVVCWLYVYEQFRLRRRAADLVAACVRLRSDVVSNPAVTVAASDWAPPSQVAAAGMQSMVMLPQAVLNAADNLATAGQSSREWLENCAYALLLGLAVSLLVAIWIAG
jgi:hypothetical protein